MMKSLAVEGMSRIVLDDELWGGLQELLPKPRGRHGKDDRLFDVFAEQDSEFFLADQAYGIDGFRLNLEKKDIQSVIPNQSNRLNPKS